MPVIEFKFLLPFLTIILRYFLFAGIPFLVFYKLYTIKFKTSKIQGTIAGKKDFSHEIIHSVMTVAVLAFVSSIVLLSPLSAYTMFYTNVNDYNVWWIPISVIISLFAHDTYFYWMHRLMHKPRLYKRIHLTHHKSTNPSPWASYSFSLGEAFIEALIAPIILFTIPIHPISIFTFTLVAFIINVYGHLGYEIMPKRFRTSFFFEIINTSVYHNLHHEKFEGNYGLYFRFWDRLMGTEHPDYIKQYDAIQETRFS